jgi:hypothetical protein
MTEKIFVSDTFRDYMEALQVEKDSRANLITFMMNTNMGNTEAFNKLQQEYLLFFMEYELAKRMLEKIYLKPKYEKIRSWNLDFRSKEITVYA